jgi:DNA-binding GntR family transcriptional regulator
VRHGLRGEHVYRRLRDAIQHGELKSGQRIMELEIADWLKVSRTRCATRCGGSRRGCWSTSRSVAWVARLDRQAVMELASCARRWKARRRASAQHASTWSRGSSAISSSASANLRGTAEGLARHNWLFHEAIHRSAHNRYLEKSRRGQRLDGLLGTPALLLRTGADGSGGTCADREAIARRSRSSEAAQQPTRRCGSAARGV